MHQQSEAEPLSLAQKCHLVGILVGLYGHQPDAARESSEMPVMWDWYRAGTWKEPVPWSNYLYALTYKGQTQMDRTAAFLWHDFWCQVAITALLMHPCVYVHTVDGRYLCLNFCFVEGSQPDDK